MATKQSQVDYILDQLSSLVNVRARKMFGEYAVYYNEIVVALICDNKLYVKITEPGQQFADQNYLEGRAYPGAKVSMLIDEDRIDEADWLSELISITAASLPAPKPKKTKKLTKTVKI